MAGTAIEAFVNEEWISDTQDKISELAGQTLARELVRQRKGHGGCGPLARIAELLLNAESKIREFALDIVGDILPPVSKKGVERKIAEKLIGLVPITVPSRVADIARGLQAIGIWICVVNDRPLGRCACWLQIEREMQSKVIETTVNGALDKLLLDASS